jgi:hypothetical protein
MALFMPALSLSLPWPFDTLAVSEWLDVSNLTVVTHAIVTLFGAFFAVRLAARAFARPPQDFVGIPTEPKYLTSAGAYKMGLYVFAGVATILFLVLLFLDKEVVAVVKLFDLPIVLPSMVGAFDGNAVPYLVVIVFIAAVYLYLLGAETPWNVILMLRDVIHIWIAIPIIGHKTANEAMYALTTPPASRAAVAAASISVAPTDFDADRGSFARMWAETSYMRWWLKEKQAQGNVELFDKESFGLDTPDDEYQALGPAAVLAKQAAAPPTSISPGLRSLNRKYARLVACYLIHRHGVDKQLIGAARQFGLPMVEMRDQNPLKYIIIYLLTVALSVYVGVLSSSIVFDWSNGMPLLAAMKNLDPEIVWRWIGYTAANFVMPIAVVLLIRFVWWKFEVTPTSSYLVTYCWTALIAFVVGPFCLALVAKYVFPVERFQNLGLLQLFGYELRWGIGPAVITVFISYYMDRLTSAALPDAVRTRGSIAWRVLLSFGIALATLILLAVQLESIPDPLPYSDSSYLPWSGEKLRFVATATTFFVVFSLAMVAQFALWKTPVPAESDIRLEHQGARPTGG